MYTPSYDEFRDLAGAGNLVPVTREILADLETPVSAFLKIDDGGDAFLLESVEGPEKWGRYSFLGVRPALVFRSRGRRVEIAPPGQAGAPVEVADPFGALREFLGRYRQAPLPGLPRFSGGLVGYLGYDLARHFERLPATARDDLGLPEQYLVLADTLLVFDNARHTIRLVAHAPVGPGTDLRAAYDGACARIAALVARLEAPLAAPARIEPGPGPEPPVESNMSEADYVARVRRAKEYIAAGDIIQVVLAQRFACPLRVPPFDIYRCLRTVNPAPYMFYLRLGDIHLVGSSPEVMTCLEDGEITVRPIAGTRPRGATEEADAALERELRADPKEIAEHVMLLDLGRNDVGRVAAVGTVAVTECMVVERYSHVMHLVSNVRGELAPGRDCFDVFRATFPAGTLTGAPKVRAMEIIEELEPVRRGIYGGAVGYFAFSGNMDTCITIRTIVAKGDRLYIGAGAGIVADSVPEREYAECVSKARALVQAVRLAERMGPGGGNRGDG